MSLRKSPRLTPELLAAARQNAQHSNGPSSAAAQQNSKKVKERRGNVHENKGPAFSSPAQSGNVTENKGSYALKAGTLVKRKDVDGGR
jgi:hypothetical protein